MKTGPGTHPQVEAFLLDALQRVRNGEAIALIGTVAAYEPTGEYVTGSDGVSRPKYELKVLCCPDFNSERADMLAEGDVRKSVSAALEGVAKSSAIVLGTMQEYVRSREATRKTIIDA